MKNDEKLLKYSLLIVAIIIVGFKSIYIKKLSEVKKINTAQLDAVAFTQNLWDTKLPATINAAVSLADLQKAIAANSAEAFAKYSHALAIGNYRYSLVKFQAKVIQVREDDIVLQEDGSNIILATEFIYGNAVRDASGLIDVKDFTNSADLNSISDNLNKLVKQKLFNRLSNK